MGFIWIALALFGLVFDPDKKVIIISQIIVGGLCFIIFIVLKLKKTEYGLLLEKAPASNHSRNDSPSLTWAPERFSLKFGAFPVPG